MSERRELYRSANGDSWYLGREPTIGYAFLFTSPTGRPEVGFLTSNSENSCATQRGRRSRLCFA